MDVGRWGPIGWGERLSGWGRTNPVRCEVIRPHHPRDVDDAVMDRSMVIARGRGRSYGDAAQAAGGTVIDTVHLDRIGAFNTNAGTVTVGAGVSLDDVLGLTGATLQLQPIETALIASTTQRYGDLASVMDALGDADATSTYTVAWIDPSIRADVWDAVW